MIKLFIFTMTLMATIIAYLIYLNWSYRKMLEKSFYLLEEATMKLDQASKYIHGLKDELAKVRMELEEYKGV